jgi:four helix bundle protein
LCTSCVAVDANELRGRVKRFAIRIVKYVQTLPKSAEAQEIGKQLVRAGTGVSANYHSASRARSRKEFIARLSIVLEEADEAEHWLVILSEAGIGRGPDQKWLLDEAGQLRAIYQQSVKTARANHPIRQ